MITLDALAQSPAVLQVGWALLHFLWQGVAIALVLTIALFALRRRSAQSRYAVGCAAMLAMAASPVVTVAVIRYQATVESARLAAVLNVLPSRLLAHRTWAESFGPPAARPHDSLESMLPAAVGLWIVGVLILTIRALGGWLVVRRLCRNAKPVEKELAERAADMARAMGIQGRIDVRTSIAVQVPSVVGCVRAVVLFPVSALTGLPTEQLEALLAHELAHVRRHDYLANLIQIAVETLLFYHPAVWWISRRIRAERENCCDDAAVALLGDLRTYATALASLEELRSARLALAAAGGELLPRIRRILGEPVMYPNRPAVFFAGALAIAMVAAPFALPRGNAEPPKAPRRIAPQAETPPQAISGKSDPFADRVSAPRAETDDVAALKARIQELEADNAKLRASLRDRGVGRPSADGLQRKEFAELRAREADMAKAKAEMLQQNDLLRAQKAERDELMLRARKQQDEARLQQMEAEKRAREQDLLSEGAVKARARSDRKSDDALEGRPGGRTDEIRALREENRAIRQQLEELRRQIDALREKRSASSQAWEKREASLEQQRYDLQQQIRQMRLVYSPNHPKFKDVQAQILDLDLQLATVRSAHDAVIPSTPAKP